ncbi:hypothetical protein AWB79_05035 [Caballeronia hypogeia]|uniref:Uncharacterized protein n=1 Tax=Caballeronia hypogeia TaxID=1777140 RepID=A0A158CAY8_9BURK|nr:hypothetical protein AWB79_05035 [Caballeronia hypogeia]
MLTPEGADDAETIVRPCTSGGWQVEVPTSGGVNVTIVPTEQDALALARSIGPTIQVRVLPATECQSSRSALDPDQV